MEHLAKHAVKSHPSRLPQQLMPFIGRKEELAELARLLADPTCRLLTLLGPGGIGKTRLAVEVVTELRDRFTHGVYFVPLQAVETTPIFHSTLADTLNLTLTGPTSPEVQLLNYLHDKETLLVLDNFEQLLALETGGPASFLMHLLVTAPGVKLLVTSREVLNLQEEWLYQVQGLPFPNSPLLNGERQEEQYSAVQLFVERARRVRRDFSLAGEFDGVVRICQLVEGMPLALELAASWVKTLPCAVIAAEIERNLDFLTTNLRNVPDRQRSMRAAFNYCWQRLNEQEQDVFKRLSLFRSGFQREAAERIAGASLSILSALVDKSLLRLEPDGRYHIHELLRQYAGEQLVLSPADVARVYDWHCTYYADFLQARYADILEGRQHQAIAEIKAELENVRAAWQWAIQLAKFEEIQKAAYPLFVFYQFQSRYLEGLHAFEEVSHSLDTQEMGPGQEAALAKVLVYGAWLYIRLGQLAQAEAVLQRSQALYSGHKLPPAYDAAADPGIVLATLKLIQGDYSGAEHLGEEACRLNEVDGNEWNLTYSFYILANAALGQGHYEAAQRHAQKAYDRAVAANDRWFTAYLLIILGDVARASGNYAAAKQQYQDSYAIRESFNDPEGMAIALNHLGQVMLREERFAEARQLYQQSLAVYQEIHDRGGLATSLHGLAAVACALSDAATARQQFRQALHIAAEIQFVPLVLSILAGIGELLLQTGPGERGAALLAFVHHHPASEHETKTKVQRLLAQHKVDLPPASESNADNDLAGMIELIQNEMAAPVQAEEQRGAGTGETILPSAPLHSHSPALIEPLTARELEILRLIADGLSNREIAAALILTVGTVKAHTHHIYGKLNATNRVQAVARARELGLLP